MPFLNEEGLQRLWTNTKGWFAKWIDATPTETQVILDLKDGQKPKDSASILDTAYIPSATSSTAGVMSASDKSKLDGVETGATANTGTIEEISSNLPITGSGTSGRVTISHNTSGVDAGTYGTTSTTPLSPSFGSTFNVPGISVNATGHITSAGSHTVKIPNSAASESSAGLMSSADKSKLDGIAEGATANTGTIEGITSTGPIIGSGVSGTVALSHADSGVAAGTYGETSSTALTPDFGDTITVPGIAVNATGHVTGAGEHLVTIPDSEASISSKGLMSSEDKAKLNGIEVGATKNIASSTLPPNVDTSGAIGSSSNYARQDHTHAILLDTGDANGQVKVAGTNISVRGLGTAAYTDSTEYATAAQGVLADNAIPSSEKGAARGVAELDESGLVPISQLPSYVDDVVEYSSRSEFPESGETGKIYVDVSMNLTYRWSGSAYVEISPSLALGETSSTAYRGDRGALAFAHAVTNKGFAFESGFYTIATNSEGHVTSAIPVSVSDIVNLGIVASDIEAAEEIHEHEASDITSGILSPAYGGTGLSNPYGIIVGYGAGSPSVAIGSGALFNTHTQSFYPTFGTLPTSCGGTGAATISEARSNLGAQAELISGTNIKTVNGESLLGSGNITISSSSNAFANVLVGSTTIEADSASSTLELEAGSGITLIPDATNDKITISSNQSGGSTWYGTSSTSESDSIKLVTCTNYALTSGNIISILFSSGNTADDIRLNINDTGAKPIFVNNIIVSSTNPLHWESYDVLSFIYDGSYFHFIGVSLIPISQDTVDAICV